MERNRKLKSVQDPSRLINEEVWKKKKKKGIQYKKLIDKYWESNINTATKELTSSELENITPTSCRVATFRRYCCR